MFGEVNVKNVARISKPFPNIPSIKLEQEYEVKYPKPQIGEEFYCKICERTITIQTTRDVNLDHDHQTGKIRGYICNRCNTGLGNFRDNISLLKRAIQWLKGTLSFLFY